MLRNDSALEEASAEMYRLHGRAVSAAADAEFHIRLIALAYGDGCGDTQGAKRCWTDAVKPILRRHDLTTSLQAEMADVAALFDARNPIAHRFVLLTTGPSKDWRIMRYWIEDGQWHMHQVSFGELRDQVDRARAGRDAARAIFGALRELDPVSLDDIPKVPVGLPWRF